MKRKIVMFFIAYTLIIGISNGTNTTAEKEPPSPTQNLIETI